MNEIDKDLIMKYQDGDINSFNNLVLRHLKNTIGFFFNITNNQMEAEDLAQDVFVKLHKHLKNFNFNSKFTTYLYRVNMNKANTWLTRNKWKRFLHLDQITEVSVPDQSIENDWKRKELWNAVEKLPYKQKQVTILRVAEQLPFKIISEVLEMKTGTAKVHFHHAVNNIKRELK